MNNKNEMILEFQSQSQNESFARTVVAAFAAQLDPTIEELADIKTAVSEAVTNCIIHGYSDCQGIIKMRCALNQNEITIEISDEGVGIENIEKAMEPLYTTRPELERSGMGFSFMEAFMDELEVESAMGKGTTVKMKKRVGKAGRVQEILKEAKQNA
ncbi:anti-sigma F factor [Lachnospiraceae bacterium MD1]|jgi:stage II sporulation protein AB (anti-sigma F factor)|uniref:Anti-sigma F factor n=1 Tax=Variimorphobacter saccharofermentans TaxID=2755051 RepID=A0A839JXP0_9FIRM|nr:anti-sigma F factor [Variimorphobacter saccharofermentans]MBB2181987.1 anti-sigma F factor [Variimorphobacter saccharofermentans]